MTDRGSISYDKYLHGDDEGMAELVRFYRDGLILYLHTYTGNIQEAEELAMDTFVKLGINRSKNKGNAGFKTWLYTIARNVAIDYLRKKSRSREVSLEECPELVDDCICLEQIYIQQERKIALHHAMQKLSKNYQQVLWLIYFEDYTAKQAATVMHRTTHSVEVLVSRARKSLRAQLEKEGLVYEDL